MAQPGWNRVHCMLTMYGGDLIMVSKDISETYTMYNESSLFSV